MSIRIKQPAAVTVEAALRKRFVVNEEEDEKDSVRSWKRNPGDYVNSLRHSDRMRGFFFANLDETWLKEIIFANEW